MEEVVNGYENFVNRSPENLKLAYADSIIYAAKNSKDNALIGSAYLSKGILYYAKKKHNYALDHYLVADNYISKTNDKYLKYKVKYNIAHIKYHLGFYDEAIPLFRECIDYFKENNDSGYLNSLHSLALCYNRIGNYDLCTETNETGLLEGKRLDNDELQAYLILSEGVNQYFQGNYELAIKKINNSLPDIQKNKDSENETVGYFYLGKSYSALKNLQKTISCFKKVESKKINYGIKDINQDTATVILKQLEKFEKDKMFLEKDFTEAKLAVLFNSNIKYLSKIISHYRGKKFVKYINDLKVDYLITLLKEDKKIKNYTNKALSEEAGFSSTERFAKAFFSRMGMPASYFMKELRKGKF
jgi:tetratricopeptide (TPR) repeat protein